MEKEIHAVVRTDLMHGTDDRANLVSVRVKNGDTPIATDNGLIVTVGALEANQREVHAATLAGTDAVMADCAVLVNPEVSYDNFDVNLGQYFNVAGKAVRAYRLCDASKNVISMTKEAFTTVPTVGATVGFGANGKWDPAKSGLGKCIAIDTVGRYTYYAIELA